LLSFLLGFFPHVLPDFEDKLDEMITNATNAANDTLSMKPTTRKRSRHRLLRNIMDFDIDNIPAHSELRELADQYILGMAPHLSKILGSVQPHCQVIRLGTAVLSMLEYSLSANPEDPVDFQKAATSFMESLYSLMDAITEVFNKSASISAEDSVKIMEILEAHSLGMSNVNNSLATNSDDRSFDGVGNKPA